MFMSATAKAAVHVGGDYQENLQTHQEHGLREDQTIAQSFTEMNPGSKSRHRWDIFTIDWDTIPWMRTTLLNDRAVKLSTAKVCVFPDSVLCLGKIQEYPTCNKLMEGQN